MIKTHINLRHQFAIYCKGRVGKLFKIFDAKGAAALLLDAKNGEILSLVSLPDYNLNKREKIYDVKYMNKITNGVFELGSIFKTFTIALALDEKLVEPKTSITGIDKNEMLYS